MALFQEKKLLAWNNEQVLAIVDRLWNVCGQMGVEHYWPVDLGQSLLFLLFTQFGQVEVFFFFLRAFRNAAMRLTKQVNQQESTFAWAEQ